MQIDWALGRRLAPVELVSVAARPELGSSWPVALPRA